PPLVVVARPQPSLQGAAEALDRGRRDHAFGCSSDAHQQVYPGPAARRGDGGSDVAVPDKVDLRAGFAKLADEVVVAIALQHDDGDVGRLDSLRRGDRL